VIELYAVAVVLVLVLALGTVLVWYTAHQCRWSVVGHEAAEVVHQVQEQAYSAARTLELLPITQGPSTDLAIASHPRVTMTWATCDGVVARIIGGGLNRLPRHASGTWVGQPLATEARAAVARVCAGEDGVPYRSSWVGPDGVPRTFTAYASTWLCFDGDQRGAVIIAIETTGSDDATGD